jgi:hypothetical protein
MSELTYYKALSAILYVIVALMFYSRCNQLISKHGGAEKILSGDEMDEQQAVAISKTAALLFLPDGLPKPEILPRGPLCELLAVILEGIPPVGTVN